MKYSRGPGCRVYGLENPECHRPALDLTNQNKALSVYGGCKKGPSDTLRALLSLVLGNISYIVKGKKSVNLKLTSYMPYYEHK
jgi:hypothetical protein